MTAIAENVAAIEAALLAGKQVRKVIQLQLANAGDDLVVGAKIDLDPELTMREVSAVLHQAKKRVRDALPAATIVYLEPDVWVDPDAAQPTTSTVVMLGLD